MQWLVVTENGSVPLEEIPVHRAEFKSVSLKYNTFINAAIIIIFIFALKIDGREGIPEKNTPSFGHCPYVTRMF